ncbi:glycosyltransferase family 4 protein [Gracilibacillus oryzae]|uniref:Glycosyltransferase family 4 protein n=1 Tax=Gracilibacillus oryzae TaxID=1672701 RepID=A0A7C8L393_9BACI|nr:glycosyltransferase family 4 protein [Gracilibacillus oryzae]KAB8133672.1 glycosyltransferase family 4 protein [Gracilibacillus oryzae]
MSKVLMYSTSQLFGKRVTGGLKRFLELYYAFRDKGIEVDLYSADSQEVLKEKKVSANSLESENVSKSILLPTELKIFIKNYKYLKTIKKREYDLIIVFDVPTAIGLCLSGFKNIQLFIRQDLIKYKRISISERTNNKLLINFYLLIMKLCEFICFIKAAKIIIQCKYDYHALIKRHSLIKSIIKKKSIIQINNVNPSWVINKSLENNNKADSNLKKGKEDKLLVGFIGDFSNERKGHRILVDAVKELIDEGISIEVILIGDGEKLTTYINECSTYPDIKFTGRLDNPITVVKKLDLMVVPSLADSCPNTIMEALYNYIPVIGARSGGIPEMLMHEISMFDLNIDSLSKRIKYYISEEKRNELKILQAQRREDLSFNWADKIIKHLEIH